VLLSIISPLNKTNRCSLNAIGFGCVLYNVWFFPNSTYCNWVQFGVIGRKACSMYRSIHSCSYIAGWGLETTTVASVCACLSLQTCCPKRCNLTSVSLRIMGPLVSRCGPCPVHPGFNTYKCVCRNRNERIN